MNLERPDFAIVGGGIGGLAAALSLAQKGFASTVFEQAERFGEIGAGIQLGPNAFFCFREMGILDAASNGAVHIERVQIMDALSGDELIGIPVDDDFKARYGNTYAVVHRADLHNVLLNACDTHELVTLKTRHNAVGYQLDNGRVRVHFSDQPDFSADALIGADGLRSRIREQVVGDGPPRVSGHASYRALVPIERVPENLRWNTATLWAGPKCHIVHYPLKGSKVFNLVVTYHNDAPEPVAGKSVELDEVRQGFEQVAALPKELVDRGRDWKLWVLCDRDPTDRWLDGNVALLGDAAHPMLQYLAQGACMAIEDAVCLAHVMHKRNGDIASALRDYQARRVVRTARVQTYSRLIGDHIYHPVGASALARNSALKSMSLDQIHENIAWLYGGTALDPAPVT